MSGLQAWRNPKDYIGLREAERALKGQQLTHCFVTYSAISIEDRSSSNKPCT